jgi:ABC-2 type transport system ATP-binding protein
MTRDNEVLGETKPPPSAGGIEATALRRTFGSVVAVDGLDLTAPAGQVTALIGPNGSGKTTLLLMLAGLLRPDAGTIRIAGVDPSTDPVGARRQIGWMPDFFGTWESLTCREALTTMADAFRVPRPEQRGRVDELLALVHLTEFADRPTQVLSRGQKQRLGLARALVHRPNVLLLDEPASGLDPRSRIELRSIVREQAEAGRTVLISSHVLAELDEMVDRAVFVAGGRTIAAQDLAGAATALRTWTVRALDDAALVAALDARSVEHGPPDRDGVEVRLAGDEAAADLIAALVADGVRLVACHPTGGVLEQAYLALSQERR